MHFDPANWYFDIGHHVNQWLPNPPWRHIPYPIAHFLGHRRNSQGRLGNIRIAVWAFTGAFCSLIVIEVVSRRIPSFRDHNAPLVIGSFGAAAVLEFYAIESPLSQPRNAVLGQLFASIVGITIRKLFAMGSDSSDLTWLAGALSCACAIVIMAVTGTVHPPAGATALLAVVDEDVAGLSWFLLPVILLDCVLMQCVALLFNNIQRRFPSYWWSPDEVGQRWRREERAKGQSNTDDAENGSQFEASFVMNTDQARNEEEPHLVIRKGHIVVCGGMHLSDEDEIYLEELSRRL